MLNLILLLAVAATPPAQQAADPDPESEARSAAFYYEALLRRRAPLGFGGAGSGPCHEIIGRFCFRFTDDDEDETPEPEHPDIVRARRAAVNAFRAWLSAEPGNPEAAGGVIRYLIEDGRPREAVSLARAHVAVRRTTGSLLLLGLALHYAGAFDASESVFDEARARAEPEERARWDDVGVLLEPGERRRYGRLDADERRAYNRRFWAFSDPSLATPGNERRSAHYARHAWIRILSEAPRTAGMVSWGGDHEEIVVRYGVPHRRERQRSPIWALHTDLRMTEIFDPRAVTLVPPALLTEGLPSTPLPGARSYLERDTVRSGYAPVVLTRLRGLAVQATRLPTAEGWALRLDARLSPDPDSPDPVWPDTVWPGASSRDTVVAGPPLGSAGPVESPFGLLVVMDTLGRELSRSPARVESAEDGGLVVRARAAAPSGPAVYQIEVADEAAGVAGVGRYRIDFPAGPLRLADPVLASIPATEPAGLSELTPLPSLVLPPEGSVYVWTEARGLLRSGGTARYAVEWWLERRSRGSPLGRVVSWLGRTLGLSRSEPPVRVSWEAGTEAGDPVGVGFTVDLRGVEPGLHRLWLTVRDRISGRAATVYRPLLLEPGAPAPIPGRR
ncbi:MAG: hypothetical protein ACOCUW_00150 [Gemmatimonadota bacterium]